MGLTLKQQKFCHVFIKIREPYFSFRDYCYFKGLKTYT